MRTNWKTTKNIFRFVSVIPTPLSPNVILSDKWILSVIQHLKEEEKVTLLKMITSKYDVWKLQTITNWFFLFFLHQKMYVLKGEKSMYSNVKRLLQLQSLFILQQFK